MSTINTRSQLTLASESYQLIKLEIFDMIDQIRKEREAFRSGSGLSPVEALGNITTLVGQLNQAWHVRRLAFKSLRYWKRRYYGIDPYTRQQLEGKC